MRIARAAQFHEFVEQIVDWSRQGEVAYVQKMRAQPVAARAVAEVLADLAGIAQAARSSSTAPPLCAYG